MEEETLSLLGNRPAADMVDPFLKILPISPATKRNCLISFRPHYGFQYQIIHQYGRITPALPLVGVTILPKAALTSFTDKAKQLPISGFGEISPRSV
jgi:hypothetical protein